MSREERYREALRSVLENCGCREFTDEACANCLRIEDALAPPALEAPTESRCSSCGKRQRSLCYSCSGREELKARLAEALDLLRRTAHSWSATLADDVDAFLAAQPKPEAFPPERYSKCASEAERGEPFGEMAMGRLQRHFAEPEAPAAKPEPVCDECQRFPRDPCTNRRNHGRCEQPPPDNGQASAACGKVVFSSYTCNGSPQGCERERFGQCEWHEAREPQWTPAPPVVGGGSRWEPCTSPPPVGAVVRRRAEFRSGSWGWCDAEFAVQGGGMDGYAIRLSPLWGLFHWDRFEVKTEGGEPKASGARCEHFSRSVGCICAGLCNPRCPYALCIRDREGAR
jgi:hypothetical protein